MHPVRGSVSVGREPACVKTYRRDPLRYEERDAEVAEERVAKQKRGYANAGIYNRRASAEPT